MKTSPAPNMELVATDALLKELFKRYGVALFVGEPLAQKNDHGPLRVVGLAQDLDSEHLDRYVSPLIDTILDNGEDD